MAATAFEIERREPVLRRARLRGGGRLRGVVGVLRFAVDPARRVHRPDHRPRPRRRGTPRARRVLGRLLRAPAGGRRARQPAAPARRAATAAARSRSACSTARRACPTRPTAEDFGNGFLMRHGYTVAWVGWQHDVPRRDGLMALDAAARRAASPGACAASCGRTLPADALPLADRYHIPYPAARPRRPRGAADGARARGRRPRGGAPPGVAVRAPRRRSRGARRLAHPLPADSSPGRSTTSSTARRTRRSSGWASSPCATPRRSCARRRGRAATRAPGRLDRAYVFGVSQSGRFLRHFLYLGLDRGRGGPRRCSTA